MTLCAGECHWMCPMVNVTRRKWVIGEVGVHISASSPHAKQNTPRTKALTAGCQAIKIQCPRTACSGSAAVMISFSWINKFTAISCIFFWTLSICPNLAQLVFLPRLPYSGPNHYSSNFVNRLLNLYWFLPNYLIQLAVHKNNITEWCNFIPMLACATSSMPTWRYITNCYRVWPEF